MTIKTLKASKNALSLTHKAMTAIKTALLTPPSWLALQVVEA
jgi:hypothetical protein